VIDAFVDALSLAGLSFKDVEPAVTGRPGYHPAALLKLYIYGYLNRVQSSRRLEREAGRNLEVLWLLGRLIPDHKTIADFRKNNGLALRKVCARFVDLCRQMGLLSTARSPSTAASLKCYFDAKPVHRVRLTPPRSVFTQPRPKAVKPLNIYLVCSYVSFKKLRTRRKPGSDTRIGCPLRVLRLT
jgi:Transposase domain (DUF772)